MLGGQARRFTIPPPFFFRLVFLLKNDGFSLNRIVLRDKKEKEKDGVFHAREKKKKRTVWVSARV